MKHALSDLGNLPLTMSVSEAAELLGVSKDRLYSACKTYLSSGQGRLRCFKVEGSSIRIPAIALLEFMEVDVRRVLGQANEGTFAEAIPLKT